MAALRRSLLFVPGGEPRKLERAREAGADTVIFDLEDAVAPPQKAEARRHVAAALRAGGFGVTEAAVRKLIQPASLVNAIVKKRVAFVPNHVWDLLGLPRGAQKGEP